MVGEYFQNLYNAVIIGGLLTFIPGSAIGLFYHDCRLLRFSTIMLCITWFLIVLDLMAQYIDYRRG